MKQPKFLEQGKTYHADRCTPLIQAVESGKVQLSAFARGGYPGERLKKSMLPQLRSIGVWDARGPQDWGLDWHRNEGIEVTFLETGRLPFSSGNEQHILEPGNLTISRPWQSHRVGNPHVQSGRLHWIILDVGVRRPHQAWQWPKWLILSPKDLRELTNQLRHNEQPVWKGSKEIGDCFRRISTCLKSTSPATQVSRLTLLVNEIFMDLLDIMRKSKVLLDPSLSSTQRTVELFLEDLKHDSEMQAEPWTVASMASQCGLGDTRFIYYCRRITNQSPMQYLNQCRVYFACKLLTGHRELNITNIAFQCGFSSSQYFASVFRKVTGMSPRTYRGTHS
jgi:AraC-like DNA-binding protein